MIDLRQTQPALQKPPALPGDRSRRNRRVAWFGTAGSVRVSSPGRAGGYCPCHDRRRRRGISLLEVLISMFVLAVGLLGVAALIPAGRFEIAVGSRMDNASMIGRAEFRDLKTRGYLDPTAWQLVDATNTQRPAWQPFPLPPNWDGFNPPYKPPITADNTLVHRTTGVVIDPLGVNAGFGSFFPAVFASSPDYPHLARVAPNERFLELTYPMRGAALSDMVFRAAHDLVGIESTQNSDLPPQQRWFQDGSMNNLRRASDGNYSWMATVVLDPTNAPTLDLVLPTAQSTIRATVSIVVFHKRDMSTAGEYAMRLVPNSAGGRVSGSEFQLQKLGTQNFKSVQPGQWILVAGRKEVTPLGAPAGTTFNQDHFRWFRVAAAREAVSDSQVVTLSGPAWDYDLSGFTFVLDNVVAVYEKNVTLEIP